LAWGHARKASLSGCGPLPTPGFRPGKAYSTSSALLCHQFWGLRFVRLAYPGSLAEVWASVRYPATDFTLIYSGGAFRVGHGRGLSRLRWEFRSCSVEDLERLRCGCPDDLRVGRTAAF